MNIEKRYEFKRKLKQAPRYSLQSVCDEHRVSQNIDSFGPNILS